MIAQFRVGEFVFTPRAEQAIAESQQTVGYFLERHVRGDWGDLSADDRARNDASITSDGRLHSSYKTLLGQTIWIITEADRSKTTLMLADEC